MRLALVVAVLSVVACTPAPPPTPRAVPPATLTIDPDVPHPCDGLHLTWHLTHAFADSQQLFGPLRFTLACSSCAGPVAIPGRSGPPPLLVIAPKASDDGIVLTYVATVVLESPGQWFVRPTNIDMPGELPIIDVVGQSSSPCTTHVL